MANENEKKYIQYKKALDNIKNYTIHCDLPEALDLLDYLGIGSYEFTAMNYHDPRLCCDNCFIEVKKKEDC